MIVGRVCGMPEIFGSRLSFEVLIKRNGHKAVVKCTSNTIFDIDFLDKVEIDGEIESRKKFDSKERVHFCNVNNLKRN